VVKNEDGENSRFAQHFAQAILQDISDPEIKLEKNFFASKKGLLRKMKEQMPAVVVMLLGRFLIHLFSHLFLK